jgi:hypothetical protein
MGSVVVSDIEVFRKEAAEGAKAPKAPEKPAVASATICLEVGRRGL